MSCHVKSYVFVDPADLGYLFQILVALLVWRYGEQTFAFTEVFVFLNNLERHIQQSHVERDFGLLSMKTDPGIAISPYIQLVFREVVNINVRQSCIAAEYKYVSDLLQPQAFKFLIVQTGNLFNREVSSVHLVKV